MLDGSDHVIAGAGEDSDCCAIVEGLDSMAFRGRVDMIYRI